MACLEPQLPTSSLEISRTEFSDNPRGLRSPLVQPFDLKCPPAEFSDIHEASELAGKIRLRDSWKAMFTRPYRQVVETQGGEGRCVAEPEAAQQLEGSLELHGTKPAVEFVAGTELG